MNEQPSPKMLLKIRLTVKKTTKNNEKIRKKEKIMYTFRYRIGCTKKIKIRSLPSLPPMIFKINKIKAKENTKIATKSFKYIITTIFSKKIRNSKIFKMGPII